MTGSSLFTTLRFSSHTPRRKGSANQVKYVDHKVALAELRETARHEEASGVRVTQGKTTASLTTLVDISMT